jgi:hypothetical protein
MKMNQFFIILISVLVLSISQSAFGGVITFQDLNGTVELEGVGETYTAQGYTFTYTPAPDEPYPTGLFSVGPPWQYNNGTTALFANSVNALTTLTRDDNRQFALLSLDLAELNGDGPVEVVFYGTKVSGQVVSHTCTLNGKTGFQRFFFPITFRHLTSVQWQQGNCVTNNPHMFDNVVVMTMTIHGPHPE